MVKKLTQVPTLFLNLFKNIRNASKIICELLLALAISLRFP